MKVKQKNLRVFEIECNSLSEFEAYLAKNAILLSNFLLLLKNDLDGSLAKECKRKALWCASYTDQDDSILCVQKNEPIVQDEQNIKLQKEEELIKQSILTEVIQEQKDSFKTIIVAKNLRSGEDIDTEADVTITGRINSGAKVKTNGNAIVLGTIDGSLEAWGDYIMVKKIGKGSVTFRGQNIKKELLDGKTKLVTFDGKLSFKDT